MTRPVAIAVAIAAALGAAAACAQGPLDADLEHAQREASRPAASRAAGVESLVAEAATALRSGRVEEGIAALDRAAGAAYQSGASGRAFELTLAAAEAARAAGLGTQAAERFRAAALGAPRDPRAAIAHRAACDALAATTDLDTLDVLDAALEEHGATWPASPFAEEAAWRRVELLARRGQWEQLLAATRGVPPDSPRRARAEELFVAAHAGLIDTGAFESSRPELERVVLGDPPAWPSRWSPLQRTAALALARGALVRGAEGAAYAAKMLRIADAGVPGPDPAWRGRAAVIRAVAALVEGDSDAAAAALEPTGLPPAERSALAADAARRLASGAAPAAEADRLRAAADALAHPAEVPSTGQAAALVAAGRGADALAAYRTLARERPDDASVQVALARLLGGSELAADREEAVGRWRAIEARCEPNSNRWFEARLGRLHALAATGRKDEARRLLALTRLLAPSLGGAARAAEFAEVATRVE